MELITSGIIIILSARRKTSPIQSTYQEYSPKKDPYRIPRISAVNICQCKGNFFMVLVNHVKVENYRGEIK